jgi:hypothetical protein
MGDCPQCKNTDGSNKMSKLAAEDLPHGGSKHKKKHTLKTRRRPQFLFNTSKRKGTRKVSSRK